MEQTNTIISKSGTMKGYSFKVWLKRNKDTLKTLVTGGVAVGVFFLPTIDNVQVSAGLAVIGGAVTKLSLDAIDFWLRDVSLEGTPPAV